VLPDGDVLPPTPPPDVDLGVGGSLARIERWHRVLLLTHFGPQRGSRSSEHAARSVADRQDLVKLSLAREGTDRKRILVRRGMPQPAASA
jgi:hypothetical protein